MIEPIMYFGIGFLVAALIGLVVIPLVHGRAVRLTMRRLEAATPMSMAEIQADKDQLRAEFAMLTRRLEMNIDQLKSRTASQLAELSKKTDAINRLKIELGEKTATVFALEARDKTLRDQARAAEEQFAARATALRDAERTLKDKDTELAKITAQLGESTVLADSQRVEIIALNTQVDALKERLTDAERTIQAAGLRVADERRRLEAAAAELTAERNKAETLGRKIAALERQLADEAASARELEKRLTEHARAMSERDFELRQLRHQVEAVRKAEADLKTANVELEAQLLHANNERTRLAREAADLRQRAEQAWSAERADNALLRERINDVAAEVARLASALEGANSPIGAILAAEPPQPGSLADRIRALQTHASRTKPGDKPN
jgi:chromosome segregation ATPase